MHLCTGQLHSCMFIELNFKYIPSTYIHTYIHSLYIYILTHISLDVNRIFILHSYMVNIIYWHVKRVEMLRSRYSKIGNEASKSIPTEIGSPSSFFTFYICICTVAILFAQFSERRVYSFVLSFSYSCVTHGKPKPKYQHFVFVSRMTLSTTTTFPLLASSLYTHFHHHQCNHHHHLQLYPTIFIPFLFLNFSRGNLLRDFTRA